DAHVFDYDGVYDAMKARESQAKSAKQAQKGPRYMEALLRSAEIRKLDHLKAQTTKYKLEAAADKAEFGETEAFVTSAYKESLEQIKRMEEEQERKAAEDAARAAKLGGMSAFYRNFLDRSDDSRGALQPLEPSASADVTGSSLAGEPAVDETEVAADGVRVNDSGEIVDKRSLLVAGALNIRKRPEPPKQPSSSLNTSAHNLSSSATQRPNRAAGSAAHDPARDRAVLDVQIQKRKAEEDAEAERERLKAKLAKKANEAPCRMHERGSLLG
ncbi:coiled-coil domain-containing protein 55-domain containing protein, partial [Catenaria anguillulae PL171]